MTTALGHIDKCYEYGLIRILLRIRFLIPTYAVKSTSGIIVSLNTRRKFSEEVRLGKKKMGRVAFTERWVKIAIRTLPFVIDDM